MGMKKDYEINENNEINEKIQIFVYFVIFVYLVITPNFNADERTRTSTELLP